MIWNAVRSNVPEGMILPWWALTVRAVLYPLDFFYWRMSKTKGYQLKNDTWLIEGVTYSGSALRLLSKATGETYRVTRTVDTLTLERLPPAEQAESDRLMHQEIDQLRKDAERYRWLRDRYAAADFQWGEHNECVLVFEWPEECSVSGSCDATIDAAMLKTPAEEIDRFRRYADAMHGKAGTERHIFRGHCPDKYQPDSRDPECEACRLLLGWLPIATAPKDGTVVTVRFFSPWLHTDRKGETQDWRSCRARYLARPFGGWRHADDGQAFAWPPTLWRPIMEGCKQED